MEIFIFEAFYQAGGVDGGRDGAGWHAEIPSGQVDHGNTFRDNAGAVGSQKN
jgi:hypothetical protein